MLNVPIIRLEVEGMRYTVRTMLAEHAAKMDADISLAVDEYCSDENLKSVVCSAAKAAIDSAVKEEIQNFFKYNGNGRLAIRQAVEEFLNEEYPLQK